MAKLEFFDTPGYGEIARIRNHYRQALRIGDRIEISGQGGWEADFTLAAASLEEEIVKAFDNAGKTLAEAGAGWRDVVNVWPDPMNWSTANESRSLVVQVAA